MKKYGVNELRQMFLDFMESKGHLVMKSFSLVPQGDKSLLLINAGMAPLKPYFTGAEIPPRTRVSTCQKCIRTGDIENVGKTARHGTFFEMLGNFSFGDYFKKEAIHWSWEFLTEVVGLDANRLYPSVYLEDDEAFDIWNKEIGIPADRIFRFGKEDNFWEHGAGPCGPCSEIYYDRGEKYGCGKPGCTVGCDCDRYMEVWNNVFTQFENDGNGNYTTLKQKNIDTGMGLERLAVVVQDVDSIFDVDTICDCAEAVFCNAGASCLQADTALIAADQFVGIGKSEFLCPLPGHMGDIFHPYGRIFQNFRIFCDQFPAHDGNVPGCCVMIGRFCQTTAVFKMSIFHPKSFCPFIHVADKFLFTAADMLCHCYAGIVS